MNIFAPYHTATTFMKQKLQMNQRDKVESTQILRHFYTSLWVQNKISRQKEEVRIENIKVTKSYG